MVTSEETGVKWDMRRLSAKYAQQKSIWVDDVAT